MKDESTFSFSRIYHYFCIYPHFVAIRRNQTGMETERMNRIKVVLVERNNTLNVFKAIIL